MKILVNRKIKSLFYGILMCVLLYMLISVLLMGIVFDNAALSIYNGILQGEAEDSKTIQEFTNLSEQELDRIETLVQNLLKITKLDAGTVIMDKNFENIFVMMECVKKRFSFRTVQENRKISLEGDEGITLLCDRNWMMEAGFILRICIIFSNDFTAAGFQRIFRVLVLVCRLLNRLLRHTTVPFKLTVY